VEAYFNLAETILHRITALKEAGKTADLKQSIKFLKIILKKIDDYGNADDRNQCGLVKKALIKTDTSKAFLLLQEYRENAFIRTTPPEVIGFKFQLRLLYSAEEMSTEVLENYEEKITQELQKNPSYPDLWHYLALIHLMRCRHYFLKGLDNFRDATRINPQFDKAVKNLRLVENDGREFLALIKTIA
jgi:tetratricopeptide (TPR) repeat protein